LRDIEPSGDVDDACVTLGINEFEDLFEVIFDRGGSGSVLGAADSAHE
jgi:hypothetical protein